ncbi:MAG: MBL fold metallo-hydrolase [Burkholderiales bacterium]|nr:MBL fold metallo-hydrolase [Burkholderiales bacterium]
MRLRFLGAAGEVTGACFLLELRGARGETVSALLDCGLFQGGRLAGERNRRFAFDPRAIAFVLLSHAHIDHSGLIPRLAARGFAGPVYCTPATEELLGVMLPDAGHLQEREAEREGEEPLYTAEQARACLRLARAVPYRRPFRPHPLVECTFRDAGHILGSAIVELRAAGRTLVYSGDLGQPGRPIVDDPETVAGAEALLVESTYGDRNHKSLAQSLEELADAITDTIAVRRGNVVIPAFAVGRTQELLTYLAELRAQKRVPPAEIYVDSPMATEATRITLRHARLPILESVRFTESAEESRRLAELRSGAIILSASGMCEGGRIRHHLRAALPRPECAIVFVGFQAAGTLGRRIVEGEPTVRIQGEEVPVRARVYTIGGLSAHAGRDALLDWMAAFARAPRQTFVVHGEPLAAHALRAAIEERLGWPARVPANGEAVEI